MGTGQIQDLFYREEKLWEKIMREKGNKKYIGTYSTVHGCFVSALTDIVSGYQATVCRECIYISYQ